MAIAVQKVAYIKNSPPGTGQKKIFPTLTSPSHSKWKHLLVSVMLDKIKDQKSLFMVYGLNIKENVQPKSQNHHFANDILI
jgi:hypothetical protein